MKSELFVIGTIKDIVAGCSENGGSGCGVWTADCGVKNTEKNKNKNKRDEIKGK